MDKILRVVVAEDEPIILNYITQKIKAADECIEIALSTQNPAEALEYIETQKVDVLFTDIEMPDMDGLELIRRARQHSSRLNIIIISGYSNFNYAQSALRYGVNDYLLKPIEPEFLIEVLVQLKGKILKQRQDDAAYTPNFLDAEIRKDLQSQTEQRDIAKRIADYIAQNFNKPMSISDIEKHFNYSASYINRIFKKQYGISPIQYQINLRIEKSKQLLLEYPKLDIKAIALVVGYSDPRYFSRVFRQIESISPSEYNQK